MQKYLKTQIKIIIFCVILKNKKEIKILRYWIGMYGDYFFFACATKTWLHNRRSMKSQWQMAEKIIF